MKKPFPSLEAGYAAALVAAPGAWSRLLRQYGAKAVIAHHLDPTCSTVEKQRAAATMLGAEDFFWHFYRQLTNEELVKLWLGMGDAPADLALTLWTNKLFYSGLDDLFLERFERATVSNRRQLFTFVLQARARNTTVKVILLQRMASLMRWPKRLQPLVTLATWADIDTVLPKDVCAVFGELTKRW